MSITTAKDAEDMSKYLLKMWHVFLWLKIVSHLQRIKDDTIMLL